MEEKYTEVPMIITGKDLDYLSDMFNWNYIALKKTKDFEERSEDSEIKRMLKNGCELFGRNINLVLSILNEGGSNEEQSN